MSEPKTLGQKLQGMSSGTLYLLLFICASVPLFFTIPQKNSPEESPKDLYFFLRNLSKDKPVLIESDWSLSTRGESGGQFEALMRIMMRQDIKFAVYAVDPINMQVARNTIGRLSKENKEAGGTDYKVWDNWVDLGVKPGLEAFLTSMVGNAETTLKSTRTMKPDGSEASAIDSPVLKGLKKLSDFQCLIMVTGTGSYEVTLERLSGKIPMGAMLTGVMGPEAFPYYKSGQLFGLSAGVKGVFDMETLMEFGVQGPGATGSPDMVKSVNNKYAGKIAEGFKDNPKWKNRDRATAYYPTLQVTLLLMISLVVIGNVGMFLAKKEAK
ncbi:MAG: hypothetical protein K8R88_11810 [Armatimonadetes bacterium]|nr:hypothetical protein [Armatimonadota bacterium]